MIFFIIYNHCIFKNNELEFHLILTVKRLSTYFPSGIWKKMFEQLFIILFWVKGLNLCQKYFISDGRFL